MKRKLSLIKNFNLTRKPTIPTIQILLKSTDIPTFNDLSYTAAFMFLMSNNVNPLDKV